jgi:hypothetical protein
LVLGLTSLAPARLAGQVRGVVSDSSGQPLADAAIELWAGGARAAATRTAPDGRFAFAGSVTREATGLVVRRIGYRPESIPIRDGSTEISVQLAALNVPLPTLVTTGTQRVCPGRDEPAARALWETMRSRYFALPYRYGMAYAGAADSGVVRAPDLGVVDEERLTGDGRSIGAALRLADSARIADSGYAVPYYVAPRKRNLLNRSERRWRYARLDSYMAQHFVDRSFGLAHTLHVLERAGSEVVLAFCPRQRDRPSIAGTLRVSADTALVSAAWRFHTPAPDEDAGGEVTFAPVGEFRSLPTLLPATSKVWRRSPVDPEYYWQRVSFYQKWAAKDTMLPVGFRE